MATIGLTDPKTYTQTVPGEATAPSTTKITDYKDYSVFVREIVAETVVMEPEYSRYITSSRSIFIGDSIVQDRQMLNNLAFGQQIKVIVEKEQNPFGLFAKKEMQYEAIDTCHDRLQLDCTMPCINTNPEFDTLLFRFDTEYAWGVRACDKNKRFWEFEYYTRQYGKSRDAKNFGQEVDLWNKVVKGLIANAATTVDAALAKVHATHYWENLGDIATNGRAAINEAAWYFQTNFNVPGAKIVMAAEAAKELIQSVETPFGLNNVNQRVNTFNQWDVPGYLVDEQVRQILGTGITVLIMERSPWLVYNNGGTIASQYPLWNADGSKQYVVIFDPRVGYMFSIEGYHLEIVPYDCDHLTRGQQDTEYTGSGITFPQWGMVLEFDPFTFI